MCWRLGDREGTPNPITCTVRFCFRLPPAMLARARIGDWDRAPPDTVVHVSPSGEVRISARATAVSFTADGWRPEPLPRSCANSGPTDRFRFMPF